MPKTPLKKKITITKKPSMRGRTQPGAISPFFKDQSPLTNSKIEEESHNISEHEIQCATTPNRSRQGLRDSTFLSHQLSSPARNQRSTPDRLNIALMNKSNYAKGFKHSRVSKLRSSMQIS